DGLPVVTTAEAQLRAGQVVVAVGNHEGEPLAAFGIVALAGGAWHSIRGGTIDSLIRLDLALSPAAQGGALVDMQGHVVGMTVLGPRRRALSIPSSTVDRAVDQLLARGHVFRARLRSRSCIIDGEAVACDDNGVASFDLVRHQRANGSIFLYAFDLIEL